jgi:AcrR family transcriptional regulator
MRRNSLGTSVHKEVRPRAGRPRDPNLESRVFAVALRVYAEAGWSGFSFDVVARRASVGKASLYLRWASKEDLLLDAVKSHTSGVLVRDSGHLREDLIDYARLLLQCKSTPEYWALLRLHLEANLLPELHARFSRQVLGPLVEGPMTLLNRALERGDLPAGAPVGLLLDSLYGAILVRLILSRPEQRAELAEDSSNYASHIVDFVLGGLLDHQP